MKQIKRLLNHLIWLEQEKVKAMIHCGRPTSI
jgi:hypothetical protein